MTLPLGASYAGDNYATGGDDGDAPGADREEIMPRSIAEIAAEIAVWREGKGFYTPSTLTTEHERDMMLGKLMLVVSEVLEAAECVRQEADINFSEEITDAVIRLFDIAHTTGIDLETEIERKMAVNRKRPMRHGKACSL